MKEQNPTDTIKLVLSGSDKGNLDYIKEVIYKLGIEDSVIITGFIQNEELYALYKYTIALVMPTFLGPTNMPLIEAAHLGCPVICSNLEGHREIMEEYATYFDPTNASEITACMQQAINNTERQVQIEKAREHILQSNFKLEYGLTALNQYLVDLIAVRSVWDML